MISSSNSTDVDLDDAFDVLRSRRRRWAVEYLRDREDACAPLVDVAEHVHRRASAVDRAQAEDVTAIYNDLYHAHVPRLAAIGIADFDADTEVVELTAVPGPMVELLSVAAGYEPSVDEE